MPTYDLIGQKYSKTRVPDSRIVNALIELLCQKAALSLMLGRVLVVTADRLPTKDF